MSKRVKIVVSVVVAVLALSITGTTATVMAQEEPTPIPGAGANRLLARVAEILNEQGYNVTEEALVNAFQQAQQEMGQKAFTSMLNRLLEDDLISDEEAEAITAWWEQKPESPDPDSMRQWLEQRPEISKPGLLHHILNAPCQLGCHLQGIPGGGQALLPLLSEVAGILGVVSEEDLLNAFMQAQQEMTQEMRGMGFGKALDIAVEQGRITPEEAIQIEDWWGQKPAAVDSVFPGASICRTTRGRQMMAVSRGWHGSRLPGPAD